ncbi:MAG: cytidylyltransferase domain-containing protein [Phycisphaerales bacterium]
MSALALILGRAGSKGVPGKNTAIVGGRPCVMWTIDCAREASLVSRIAVSTDDESMQRLAIDAGVDVVARPAHLASDAATVDDAARHAVEALGWNTGPVALLYANAPVRPAGLIDRALALLEATGCDSVQSVARVGKHHPWWTARLGDDGRLSPWEGTTLNNNVFRRQDLPPAYLPDGGALVVTRRALFREIPGVADGPHAFLGADRRAVATEEGEVVDIDSPVDLVVADALLRGAGDLAAGQRPPAP